MIDSVYRAVHGARVRIGRASCSNAVAMNEIELADGEAQLIDVRHLGREQVIGAAADRRDGAAAPP